MKKEILDIISEEMTHAGEDQERKRLLSELEALRITPDKEIPPMRFLFQMFCRPCFPRGELVALAGKAKSGKTFVCSILMTLCFRQEVLSVRRMEDKPLSVLWFDTEQSEESTQDILNNRIIPMIGTAEDPSPEGSGNRPDGKSPSPWGRLGGVFHIFNVRSRFWQDRLPLLEAAMKEYAPDLVILDGIRDLVNDINDGVLAQEVIERLMHLASDTDSCMVCILHQNKSSEDKNLRGWIGTELKNKAFEVYECSKDADRIFTWQQTDTRKYDIVDKLKYTVGDDGIPRLCAVEDMPELKAAPPSDYNTSRTLFAPEYVIGRDEKGVKMNVQKLFTDAFHDSAPLSCVELQKRVMELGRIVSYRFYNSRRQEALDMGVIRQAKDVFGHVVYFCPEKLGTSPADSTPSSPTPPS